MISYAYMYMYIYIYIRDVATQEHPRKLGHRHGGSLHLQRRSPWAQPRPLPGSCEVHHGAPAPLGPWALLRLLQKIWGNHRKTIGKWWFNGI